MENQLELFKMNEDICGNLNDFQKKTFKRGDEVYYIQGKDIVSGIYVEDLTETHIKIVNDQGTLQSVRRDNLRNAQ
jgi:hypothetical protein